MSEIQGYTGISYPFRVNQVGGISMSTTNDTDPKHIEESLEQLLKTQFLERAMEGGEIYTSLSSILFEPNNVALQQVLKTRIVNDIERLENRISLKENDIEFLVEVGDNGSNILYISLTYVVHRYNSQYTSRIKIGELNNE